MMAATGWRLRSPLAAGMAVVALAATLQAVTAFPTSAATTGSVTLSVDRWDANLDTGKVSYDMLLSFEGANQPGGPCDGFCSYQIKAFYRDGTVEREQHTIANSYTLTSYPWSYSGRAIAEDQAFREVTHLRADLVPYMDDTRESYTTGWIPVSDIMRADVDVVPYVAFVSAPAACELLLEVPGPHERYKSSVNDFYLDCSTAAAAGNWTLVAKVMATAGATVGATTGVIFVMDKAATRHPSSEVDELGVPVPPPAPVAQRLLADAIGRRNGGQLDREQTEKIADRCRQLVARASLHVDDLGQTPCEYRPIFVPGDDVYEPALHDLEAITSNAAWTELTHARRAERVAELEAAGWSESWYDGHPLCEGKLVGQQCDEYPYMASEQGGPRSGAAPTDPPETWLGASLKKVDGDQNRREGGFLGNFKQSCGIIEQGRGAPFLVVPVPGTGINTQTKICAGG